MQQKSNAAQVFSQNTPNNLSSPSSQKKHEKQPSYFWYELVSPQNPCVVPPNQYNIPVNQQHFQQNQSTSYPSTYRHKEYDSNNNDYSYCQNQYLNHLRESVLRQINRPVSFRPKVKTEEERPKAPQRQTVTVNNRSSFKQETTSRHTTTVTTSEALPLSPETVQSSHLYRQSILKQSNKNTNNHNTCPYSHLPRNSPAVRCAPSTNLINWGNQYASSPQPDNLRRFLQPLPQLQPIRIPVESPGYVMVPYEQLMASDHVAPQYYGKIKQGPVFNKSVQLMESHRVKPDSTTSFPYGQPINPRCTVYNNTPTRVQVPRATRMVQVSVPNRQNVNSLPPFSTFNNRNQPKRPKNDPDSTSNRPATPTTSA